MINEQPLGNLFVVEYIVDTDVAGSNVIEIFAIIKHIAVTLDCKFAMSLARRGLVKKYRKELDTIGVKHMRDMITLEVV